LIPTEKHLHDYDSMGKVKLQKEAVLKTKDRSGKEEMTEFEADRLVRDKHDKDEIPTTHLKDKSSKSSGGVSPTITVLLSLFFVCLATVGGVFGFNTLKNGWQIELKAVLQLF